MTAKSPHSSRPPRGEAARGGRAASGAGGRRATAVREPLALKVMEPWRAVLFLGLVAVGLRLWSVLYLAPDIRIASPILDGNYYLELARRLSRGGGWPSEPFFMTPLYPWLLSFLFRVFPATPMTVQWAQSVLGLATLGLLVATARRDLGAPAAWAIALLYVLCGPILCIENQVLTESLLLFLAVAALWFWPRPGRRWPAWFALGMVCGLMSIARGAYLLLPVLAAYLWWRERRRPVRRAGTAAASGPPPASAAGARAALPPFAAMLAGLVLALLPLALHQARTTGHPSFTTLNGGLNLYLGNNVEAVGLYHPTSDYNPMHDMSGAATAGRALGHPVSFEEASRYWSGRALDFMAQHPDRALGLFARKALLSFSPLEIPQIEDFQLLRESTPPLQWAFVDFRWILPLAVLGLVTVAPERRGRLIPWLGLPLVGFLLTVVFFATGRYRIAVLPGYLGPAAIGLVSVWEVLRRRRSPIVLWVLPAVVAVQLILPAYSLGNARALDAYETGARLERNGQAAEAVESFSRAIRYRPGWDMAWHGLGLALMDLGRMAEARQALLRAEQLSPQTANFHHSLGVFYEHTRDPVSALAEYSRAAQLEPQNPIYRADDQRARAAALGRGAK